MADRSSAAIFGELFEYAAKSKPPNKKLAKKLWSMSTNYDFSPCQMDADRALLKLGLAEVCKDPDGYEEWLYGPPGDRS